MLVKNELLKGIVVYRITNTVNGKVYVGITGDAKRRIQAHMTCVRRRRGSAIHNAMRKYGTDKFTFEVMCKCGTIDYAYSVEMGLIRTLDTQTSGYNVTAGGDGVRSLNAESLQRLRASLSAALRGVPKSKEHVEAMRKSVTGRVFSESHRKAIAAAKTGTKASVETRRRMSETRTGRPMSENARKALLAASKLPKTEEARRNISKAARSSRGRSVVCVETGELFECLTDAATWLRANGRMSASPSAIGFTCRGGVPRAYGFTWRYADISKEEVQ